jgi:hypothetical protein
MTKVVFAGPSIYGVDRSLLEPFEVRPPARNGDILSAARNGATAIGLIDGVFETCLSVWHKEILYALAAGIRVLGAASLGALRAAECDQFGMEGVGKIYEEYRSGQRTADADVAILHAPAELGYRPLTVALVDVEATLAQLERRNVIAARERAAIEAVARQLHFKQRSWGAILDAFGAIGVRRTQILDGVRRYAVSQKAGDAERLLTAAASPSHAGSHRMGRTGLSRTVFLEALQKRT